MLQNLKVSPSILDTFYNLKIGRYNETEQRLIDRINKVAEYQQTEAMHKGTAFHHLTQDSWKQQRPVKGKYKVEWFEFDQKLTEEIGEQRSGAFHEQYVGRFIQTSSGPVWLYGYVDDIFPLVVKDLKTGSNYYQNKYEDSFQWRTYLWCTKSIRFEYIITDFTNIYHEEYFNGDYIEPSLVNIIDEYSIFVNDNIAKIDLTKITHEISR